LGYECCDPGTYITFSDENGYWGTNAKNEWCGINAEYVDPDKVNYTFYFFFLKI